jgi:hypothetical protein
MGQHLRQLLIISLVCNATGVVTHSTLVEQRCFDGSQALTFRPNITSVTGGGLSDGDQVVEIYADTAMKEIIASGTVRSSAGASITAFSGALIHQTSPYQDGWGFSECTSTVVNPTQSLAKVICKYNYVSFGGSPTCAATYSYSL